jgi:dTDP-4-amino-4,6-dideoxy-D-galactose acyltransferase
MIETLNWDSGFFGYPVGRIIINDNTDSLLPYESEIRNFKLIYLFSDNQLSLNDGRVHEVDIKTTLVKGIAKADTYPVNDSIVEYTGGQDEDLKALALESGVFSRFKMDPGFKDDEYTKLYLKWITDSINKKIADKLFIYSSDGFIEGFVSMKLKETNAEIGLIAVHEKSRGKGVGMALLQAVFHATQQLGLPCTKIVTQLANAPAMKLYLKAGFEIESKKFIYHLWNK